MKKLKKRERLLLYLLIIVVVAAVVWFVVLDKYTGTYQLPPVKVITPVAEDQGIKVHNTVKTTVSVVEPSDEETAE